MHHDHACGHHVDEQNPSHPKGNRQQRRHLGYGPRPHAQARDHPLLPRAMLNPHRARRHQRLNSQLMRRLGPPTRPRIRPNQHLRLRRQPLAARHTTGQPRIKGPPRPAPTPTRPTPTMQWLTTRKRLAATLWRPTRSLALPAPTPIRLAATLPRPTSTLTSLAPLPRSSPPRSRSPPTRSRRSPPLPRNSPPRCRGAKSIGPVCSASVGRNRSAAGAGSRCRRREWGPKRAPVGPGSEAGSDRAASAWRRAVSGLACGGGWSTGSASAAAWSRSWIPTGPKRAPVRPTSLVRRRLPDGTDPGLPTVDVIDRRPRPAEPGQSQSQNRSAGTARLPFSSTVPTLGSRLVITVLLVRSAGVTNGGGRRPLVIEVTAPAWCWSVVQTRSRSSAR